MKVFLKSVIYSLLLSFAFSAAIKYEGDCKEIQDIVEDNIDNIEECTVNDYGEVTTLKFSDRHLKEEQVSKILSYNTISVLHFTYYCFNNSKCSIKQVFPKEILNLPLKEFHYNYHKMYEKRKTHRHYTSTLESNLINKLENIVDLELDYIELSEDNINEILSLKKLKKLNLSSCIMNGISFDFLKNIKKLNSLDVIMNTKELYIDIIPQLRYLNNLESLNIRLNLFNQTDIDEIANLKNLKSLKIFGDNSNPDLNMNSINNLTNLNDLIIDFSYSDEFTEVSFSKLKKLNNLYLGNAILSQANIKEISKMSKLQKLTLYNCDLAGVEDFSLLSNLKKIEEFEVDDCKDNECNYDQIIATACSLKSLKKLDLNFMYGTVPNELGNLRKLEYLDLGFNDFDTIPNVFSNMKNLKKLYLDSNKLTEIPDSIMKLKYLEELDMRFNDLTIIPDSINKLKNLVYLDLSENDITNLPSSLGDLINLEHLDLHYNKIEAEVPESLNSLTKLKYLDLHSNIKLSGKTLALPSLEYCYYTYASHELCVTMDMECLSTNGTMDPCSEN